MNVQIFSVSLARNLPTIIEAIKFWRVIYPSCKYTVICPYESISDFSDRLSTFENLQIVSEDSIISFHNFRDIHSKIRGDLRGDIQDCDRLSWYYQQALKIAFAVNQKLGSADLLVMWDADTIPLKNIKFCDGKYSMLYGSLIENHPPYHQSLENLFKKKVYSNYGFTVQFFSLTLVELTNLYALLDNYLPLEPRGNYGVWISKVILSLTIGTHKKLSGSLFSEQELVGFCNQKISNRKQRKLMYLRLEFKGPLSSNQRRIASILGFAHLTYEDRKMFVESKERWGRFLALLIKNFIRQNSSRTKFTESGINSLVVFLKHFRKTF